MIDYLIENGFSIFNAVTLVVAAASAVAALTPTPKDDNAVAKVRKVVNWLALNIFNAKNK